MKWMEKLTFILILNCGFKNFEIIDEEELDDSLKVSNCKYKTMSSHRWKCWKGTECKSSQVTKTNTEKNNAFIKICSIQL